VFKTTREASRLLLEGSMVLAEMEHHGVRVDKTYLESAIVETEAKIAGLERRMMKDEVGKVWKKAFGDRAKLSSRDQLAVVLFDKMGISPEGKTAGGRRGSTKKADLDKMDLPFLHLFVRVEELKKAVGTYLKGIRREMVPGDDGCWYVHHDYKLNTARTFRSSAAEPNFQNNPQRNPELGEIVRRCYIPRKGHDWYECDYEQLEVKIGYCHHKDPKMKAYLEGDKGVMHTDAACDVFLIKPSEVVKGKTRDAAKNMYVFPQFYGSVYFQCAPHLWHAMVRRDMRVGENGIPIREHLARKGIKSLGACDPRQEPEPGTFEHHLRDCERKLWRRFKGYADWKVRNYEEYLRTGGIRFKTGFAVNGKLKRNDVGNYAIQGDAFQCLLWSDVQKLKALRKYKMGTKLMGEIHDCDDADVPKGEGRAYVELSKEIMERRVAEHWDWIVTPLTIDVEVAEEGKSWYDKHKL
jgi:DNA polymerase-1